MCTYAECAYALLDDARKSTLPLDMAMSVIFFVPSVYMFALSIGTGYLIRVCVERSDRLHAEQLAKLASATHTRVQAVSKKASKKRRPR